VKQGFETVRWVTVAVLFVMALPVISLMAAKMEEEWQ